MAEVDRTIVKLKRPIPWGDETITELAFREIEAGDLFGFTLGALTAEADLASLLRLAGRLCGQPEAVIKKVKGPDLGEVLKLLVGFIDAIQPTGSEESPS